MYNSIDLNLQLQYVNCYLNKSTYLHVCGDMEGCNNFYYVAKDALIDMSSYKIKLELEMLANED